MIAINAHLVAGIAYGLSLKHDHAYGSHWFFGKEYYAVETSWGDGLLLDFIQLKAEELYPELAKTASFPDTFWALYKVRLSIFTYAEDVKTYFIHKRRFKRHLKKALIHSRAGKGISS
ncbi:hypothetical protein ST201phi2-1p178 [Pseudomonas phage 201phi2-1]|uniref:Uncharacterized protein n=1 Tax=Pseudomonas phage 201phi2-1 TaxID=198110 RepID=B3FJ41_BP201|nr:hypothetical protein ST201phi2-1p178 [Pseudomonas phage 201phi2-1]ABY63008.1 hypothetical protein 201phi2-1p178 [Pseudomonas phage 201phi2-1]